MAPSSRPAELLQTIGAECVVGPRLILEVSSSGVGNGSSHFGGCRLELHTQPFSSFEVHSVIF